jgi:hypothetical protein
VKIAQDSVAGTDDGRTLALNEESERVPIARENGIDGGAFICDLDADCGS